jgi:hypothetical protein
VARPDKEQKKKIAALKRDVKTLQERSAALERLASQVGGVITAAEAKELILRKHHDLVAEQLERYLGVERRGLIRIHLRYWDKYAISAKKIEISRSETLASLERTFAGLRYTSVHD